MYILTLMPATKQKKNTPKKAVLVVFPVEVLDALNAAVEEQDTDRSKFIRKAVRQLLSRTA